VPLPALGLGPVDNAYHNLVVQSKRLQRADVVDLVFGGQTALAEALGVTGACRSTHRPEEFAAAVSMLSLPEGADRPGQRRRAVTSAGCRPTKDREGVPRMLTGELWEGLSPEELEQAEHFCPERHFPEAATIFAPGDPSDALYVLKSGIVTLSHVSEDGQESILRVLIPGNVFGELFLTTPARPFLASTLTPCVVTVIPTESFHRLLAHIPKLGLNFIGVLSRRLTDLALDRGQFAHKRTFQRLALILLKLSGAHGVESDHWAAITLPLTHQRLADMIGSSRETVSRHLALLKRQGAVEQTGRTLLVMPAHLQEVVPEWPAPAESPVPPILPSTS
jgi:CRP/FNR family cyclic AMP-dependent transcriptional regulator